MSDLITTFVSDLIAAGDTTVLAAGRALHARSSESQWIPVAEHHELEYFRTVQRFARFGGDRDVAHALLSWAETEYAEHELE